jgi:hypothetical protein
MAQQTINIGTVANDGTGDPLRTAFDKTNDNFTEVYAGLGVPDDSVTYAKFATEYKTRLTSSDFSYNDGSQIKVIANSGSAIYTVIGISIGEVKEAIVTGGTSLAFDNSGSVTHNIIAGEYDPAATNYIQIACTNSQEFFISISQVQ